MQTVLQLAVVSEDPCCSAAAVAPRRERPGASLSGP
jgi:hypothetical protein